MPARKFWSTLDSILGANFAEDRDLAHSAERLSRAFTTERMSIRPDYFADDELHRGYVAYFLPLNFFKVRLLLDVHKIVGGLLKNNPTHLRALDFGSGPATASLAFLDAVADVKGDKTPKIEIHLVERQEQAVDTATNLIEMYAKTLKLDVTVTSTDDLPGEDTEPFDIVFAVNVLNELSADDSEKLSQLWKLCAGPMLAVEPSHRVASQRLVRFRERLLKEFEDEALVLGPCTHRAECPVNRTDNWCHFSEPLTDGRMIDLNLRFFKDPRKWLKFSYLCVRHASPQELVEAQEAGGLKDWDGSTYRAIGDLHPIGGKERSAKNPDKKLFRHGAGVHEIAGNLGIDLCEPERKRELKVSPEMPAAIKLKLVRGAVVKMDKFKVMSAVPMTPREAVAPGKSKIVRSRTTTARRARD